MRASTLFALTLAVLAGLGVAIVAKMTGVFNPPQAAAEAPKPKPREVQVLAANRNIFAGDLVDPTFVKTRTLRPEELDHYDKNKDAYLPASPAAVYLRIAKENITAEQPITKDMLKEMAKPEPLDTRIVPSMRAVNVSLMKDQAAGGLIQVGDWVDVMLTSTVEAPGIPPSTRTACIAPRVRVIAKRNTLWPVFAPLPEDKPVHYTLEVNPYRAAIMEFTRGKGQITLAPLPATEQRKLEALRADLMKNPDAAGNGVQFISFDENEISLEEARVESLLKGHTAVSEADMIRIFNLTTPPPPTAPDEAITIERVTGTYHRDPLFFNNKDGRIVAVGSKRLDLTPDMSKKADQVAPGGQIKFTAPECKTCKDKAAAARTRR